MLNEMLTGYKIKDRFRELSDTYNFKRRNVELRQINDRELMQAQDQVDTTHWTKQKLTAYIHIVINPLWALSNTLIGRPTLAVTFGTAYPSTASVPTSYYLMWHYNCLLTLKGYKSRLKAGVLRDSAVLLFVRLFVCRQCVLNAARAYRVDHSGRVDLFAS